MRHLFASSYSFFVERILNEKNEINEEKQRNFFNHL